MYIVVVVFKVPSELISLDPTQITRVHSGLEESKEEAKVSPVLAGLSWSVKVALFRRPWRLA